MTWRRSLRQLLPLVCLLLAGPAVLNAEEADLACLFAAPPAANASSEPAPPAVERLPEPLPAATACGTCSFPSCRFKSEGSSCTTFGGNPGTCFVSGRLCSLGSFHCGCG